MSSRSGYRVFMVGVFVMLSSRAVVMAELRPANLRCEYLSQPMGVDVASPRLSWTLESGERGQVQTACQVLVARSPQQLAAGVGDLWDSGKVVSSESLQVAYAGKPLASGMRVYWKVRVWDRQNKPSDYSGPAWWEMGLLDGTDWRATWIDDGKPLPTEDADFFKDDPAPLFRREFQVTRPVKQARVYVSGLGYYELSLNGKRVGDRVLDPAWTSYGRRVLYCTYDVTDQLRPGRNAVGMMLGNGWYNPLPLRMWGRLNLREHLAVGRPRAILQMEIEYEDGTWETVVTDGSWKVGGGPMVRNSIYLGEVYDARREQRGWDEAAFNDTAWRPVVAATGEVGPLRSQMMPPIRIARTLQDPTITEPASGVFIFDFGQNLAGWVTLRVRGSEAGRRVRMRFGELLHEDGSLNVMTSVCGQIKKAGAGGPGAPDVVNQEDTYICKGGGQEEVYRPRFTFHGFRYVEVTGYPGRPVPDALEAHLLHSAVAEVGSFECSNAMLNRVHAMVRWTLLSNMFSVESDCPHRERFGYGGDIVAASEMAVLNLDMSSFYAKAATDFVDAVRPNGGFTETAPFVGIDDAGLGDGAGPIGWGTVQPMLLWQMYEYYGNRRLLEDYYPAARRYVELLQSKAQGHIVSQCIGDHESLVPKATELTSTAFYYYDAMLLARMARVLGRSSDANKWENLAAEIKVAFVQKFLDAGTGKLSIGTQAAQAFGLYFDLVPKDRRGAVLDVLLKDIEAHDGHLTTGIFGTKYMLDVLSTAGRADVAYRMVTKKDFPGWGHMLDRGATTLWEHWEFSDNVHSHNHPMFGSVSEWMFKHLAGIQPQVDAVGFDRAVIRPQIVGDLQWVKGRYDSVRGPIVSEWKVEAKELTLHVAIPPGASAVVQLPTNDVKAITEGGRPVQQAQGIELRPVSAGRVGVAIGSGDYTFRISGFTRE